MQPIALYVHIPFCETKCPYCDFNTYAKIESLIPDYVSALRTEIELWAGLLESPPVRTIFFGGGTPSYLPSNDITALMATISESFTLQDDAEVTLEANPGRLHSRQAQPLPRYAGINRLSIGVQSFDDGLLRLLGRRHSAADAVEAYRMAYDAGFANVSIDLMYGLPHQTIDHWQETLSRTGDLHPPHVSLYALTLEGGTPMEHSVAQGTLPTPDPDLAADMYAMAGQDLGVPRLPTLRDIQLGRRWQTGFAQHRLLAQRAVPGRRPRGAFVPRQSPLLEPQAPARVRQEAS